MEVLELTYAGGLDFNIPVKTLLQTVQDAGGLDLLKPGNEAKVEEVESRLTQAAENWFQTREPWFDAIVYGFGEHDVTPEEMRDGEWTYTLVVAQEQKSAQIIRRRVIQPIEQPLGVIATAKRKISSFLGSDAIPSEELVMQLTPETPTAIIPDPELLVFEPEKYRRVYKFLQLNNDQGDGDSNIVPDPEVLIPVS
jgi:hypothetical protein